jgi:hypothetical protein
MVPATAQQKTTGEVPTRGSSSATVDFEDPHLTDRQHKWEAPLQRKTGPRRVATDTDLLGRKRRGLTMALGLTPLFTESPESNDFTRALYTDSGNHAYMNHLRRGSLYWR